MSNTDLIDAIEDLTLDPDSFGHVEHVRLGHAYLRHFGLVGSLDRVPRALRRFAEHAGAPDKYHETITCALLVLIHERMAGNPDQEWPAFAASNPDLLEWREGAFFRYYGEDVLESDLAREIFVLPGPFS